MLWLLLSFRGRISREVYWLAYLLIVCVQSAVLAQLVGLEEASFHGLAASIGPFVLLASLYGSLSVSVKRLHDVGYSGFLGVAILIPFLNLAFAIWVGLLRGTAGPNAYGDVADVAP
jgi:uncharacterized membrane protein YhaH (DUF805 family)